MLPISLLCQRSRLHLSQTIITAASTAGSKSFVGEGEGKGGVEQPTARGGGGTFQRPRSAQMAFNKVATL